MLPKLLAEHGATIADELYMPRAVIERLGVVPSYYLRYHYAHDEVVRELRTKPSRASEVAAMEKQLLEMYGDPELDEKPALLAKLGGAYYSEAAVDLAASLLRGNGRRPEGPSVEGGGGRRAGSPAQVVNTYNRGTPAVPAGRRGDRGTGEGQVVVMAAVALGKLGLLDEPAPVLLGGGVLAARHPQLDAMIAERLAVRALKAVVDIVTAPPVLGAGLLGLDHLGAPSEAHVRLAAQYAHTAGRPRPDLPRP